MIVAVFSDVHANLPALETFVQATKSIADSYVCLGDVVNYGPWNDECLEIVHSLPGIIMLEGNHERLFRGDDPIEEQPPLVRDFYFHSIQHFSRRDLINNLPLRHRLGKFLCTHTIENGRIYPDTRIEVTSNYIIGHSHHHYSIKRSGKMIINSGSIGQHRGSIEKMTWALYDTETEYVALCEDIYPLDRFLQELLSRGYSRRCLEYYLEKRRTILT